MCLKYPERMLKRNMLGISYLFLSNIFVKLYFNFLELFICLHKEPLGTPVIRKRNDSQIVGCTPPTTTKNQGCVKLSGGLSLSLENNCCSSNGFPHNFLLPNPPDKAKFLPFLPYIRFKRESLLSPNQVLNH